MGVQDTKASGFPQVQGVFFSQHGVSGCLTTCLPHFQPVICVVAERTACSACVRHGVNSAISSGTPPEQHQVVLTFNNHRRK